MIVNYELMVSVLMELIDSLVSKLPFIKLLGHDLMTEISVCLT